jgi:hypothetical protein
VFVRFSCAASPSGDYIDCAGFSRNPGYLQDYSKLMNTLIFSNRQSRPVHSRIFCPIRRSRVLTRITNNGMTTIEYGILKAARSCICRCWRVHRLP